MRQCKRCKKEAEFEYFKEGFCTETCRVLHNRERMRELSLEVSTTDHPCPECGVFLALARNHLHCGFCKLKWKLKSEKKEV